ncbi:MAG: ribosome maturation factor RimM [Bacteroidia bacterium]
MLENMEFKDYFSVGYVSRTVGLKGEFVIQLDVDEPLRYKGIDALFLETPEGLVPFFIKDSRVKNRELTVLAEGISNSDEAKKLTGCHVWLPLEILPPLDETQFYFHEISGFEVIDSEKGNIGIADAVADRMMQPVLIVRHPKAEVLIPLAKGVVQKVDRAARHLYIQAPEGLIDLYLDLRQEEDDSNAFEFPKGEDE